MKVLLTFANLTRQSSSGAIPKVRLPQEEASKCHEDFLKMSSGKCLDGGSAPPPIYAAVPCQSQDGSLAYSWVTVDSRTFPGLAGLVTDSTLFFSYFEERFFKLVISDADTVV